MDPETMVDVPEEVPEEVPEMMAIVTVISPNNDTVITIREATIADAVRAYTSEGERIEADLARLPARYTPDDRWTEQELEEYRQDLYNKLNIYSTMRGFSSQYQCEVFIETFRNTGDYGVTYTVL
jgi:hypothetical protein